jgi:hypothetical protein
MESMKLTERQRRVLAACEERKVFHIYDLPLGVGQGTMEGITHLGLVELADPERGCIRVSAPGSLLSHAGTPFPKPGWPWIPWIILTGG